MQDSLATEGDEWIRVTARVAAVPDMLTSRWTLVASPKAWHLSGWSVRPAQAVDGKAQFHLRPRADRTACGACENVWAWAVILPALKWRSGLYVP